MQPGKVLIVPHAGVHEIIATIPDLSNILVTTFAARRQILMLSAVASLTIIGREEDAEALRLLIAWCRHRPDDVDVDFRNCDLIGRRT
jgi:thioredoxin reductase (NADPH)